MTDVFSNGRDLMRRDRKLFRLGIMAGLLTVLIISAQPLPASFTTRSTLMHVVIDGIDYGAFDKVPGLDAMLLDPANQEISRGNGKVGSPFHKIVFKRDFVTDKSLYLWATNAKETPGGIRDIRLVMKNTAGLEVSSYVLKFCQPMAWSVEAANPAMGGFHESVAFAVQNVFAE